VTHLDRHGVQPKTGNRQAAQTAHMFHNRYLGCQQNRMHGTSHVGRIVDIEGIDAYQSSPGLFEPDSRFGREKGMTFKVLLRLPMSVPAGVDQDRFAGHISPGKQVRADGPPARFGPKNQPLQVGGQACQW
jgi:hypothetical protein